MLFLMLYKNRRIVSPRFPFEFAIVLKSIMWFYVPTLWPVENDSDDTETNLSQF